MTTGIRQDRIGGRLRAAWQALRSRTAGVGADMARIRLMYERFREILANNDATLQLIAEIDEHLAGRAPFALDAVLRQVRRAEMDVFVMVKNLNQLSGNAHSGLYPVLRGLAARIDALCPAPAHGADRPLVATLDAIRLADAASAGTKAARLGEARAAGLAVPDGFVATTAAFAAFMSENGLWERAERLGGLVGQSRSGRALADACREVQQAIRAAPVPAPLASALFEAFDSLDAGGDLRVAVRSSAIGEDTHVSHAGQYRTELGVTRARLLDAYRSVLASTYSRGAVQYRFEHGVSGHEALMAVGFLRMLDPRCSGVMFSRRLDALGAEAVVIAAVPGMAVGLVAGEEDAQVWVVEPGGVPPRSAWLSGDDVAGLAAAARRLEACFGGPQEIEWAIDRTQAIVIVQSRPLVPVPAGHVEREGPIATGAPLLAAGRTACPGVGAGPVVLVRTDEDLDAFPEGGVLVARQARAGYSRVLSRCAAVVTDVGSPAGHMSSLAREYGVPAIVGAGDATRRLAARAEVTVDAGRREVFAGLLAVRREGPRRDAAPESPALETLRKIARLVTPLSLTDPASREFRPDRCRSLHDVTRYVHEKTFEVMFQWGDVNWTDTTHARYLDVRLPVTIHVIDVGGGLRADGEKGPAAEDPVRQPRGPGPPRIGLDAVVSAPFRALLAGMLDPRIRWDRPRPLSARGFLAVVGERMAGLPGEALRVGGASYAIVSDRYLNFSTKAGYHFATVDAFCGDSLNKNYIHFRFAGGAADTARRERRVRFIAAVLVALDFRVQTRSDLLVARLEKFDAATLLARLEELGRLCMCTRQLDMLMDTNASAEFFARSFLSHQLDRF